MLPCFRQSGAKRRHTAAQPPLAASLCGDQDRGPPVVQSPTAPDWAHENPDWAHRNPDRAHQNPVIISRLAQRHPASAGELLRHPQGQSPSHSSSILQAHVDVMHE